MTTLADIATGIQARLATITGLHVYDHSAANPAFPAALILPPEIDYRQSMRAAVNTLSFQVAVLVGAADHANQKLLFGYVDANGAQSLRAAIDASPTLGLAGIDAHIMASRPLGMEEVDAYGAFGAMFDLLVVLTNP